METEKVEQPRPPLLREDGTVDLSSFRGALPKQIEELPDELFERWVSAYHEIREGFTTPVTIALFQRGGRGLRNRLITHDLGDLGVVVGRPRTMEPQEGVPYVVALKPPETKDQRYLRVVIQRQPTHEDIMCLKRQGGARVDGYRFTNKRGDGAIARLDNGKVVLPERESALTPADGEEWVTQIVAEKERFCIGRPLGKVEDWSRELVSYDGMSPVVIRQHFRGVSELVYKEQTLRIDSPEKLEREIQELAPPEQAILARIWNIHKQAQREAWEAYREGRVHWNIQESEAVVAMDGETCRMQPVTLTGEDERRYDILVDHPHAVVEAWRRYDGDRHAIAAEEAYKIVTDERVFASYLLELEKIDLHLEELQATRPQASRLYIGNLQKVVKNYRGRSAREVARAEFNRQHRVEARDINNDVLRMTLVFNPTLYARDQDHRESGREGSATSAASREPGLVGDDGRVYEVEYTLAAGDVEYRDRYAVLPEQVQGRIADVLASRLARLRESRLDTSDGAEKVSRKKASQRREPQADGR